MPLSLFISLILFVLGLEEAKRASMEMGDILVVVSKRRRLELASVSTHCHRSRACPRHHRSQACPCHHRSQTRPRRHRYLVLGMETEQRKTSRREAKEEGGGGSKEIRASAVDCVEESSDFEHAED
ncbi:uncharacterized protein LOC106396118 isoform X2 [Brassica napus]|uniref:uncharacterized protein LOC106396118 isoform X2 n=1 Tax=Brassica napus TaxID=3708 RepID=UPI000BBE9B52|nr:uncharacterized protein LOC106396118 isoform X2 [Brassica napus]